MADVSIHTPHLFHQRITFDDIGEGKKTPTDIDLVLDFRGELIIVVEAKYKGTDITTGQRILLETLHRGYTKGLLLPAIAIHQCNENVVSTRDMSVIRYMYQDMWIDTNQPLNSFIRMAQRLPRS